MNVHHFGAEALSKVSKLLPDYQTVWHLPEPRRPTHGDLASFQPADIIVAGVLSAAIRVMHQAGSGRPVRR